MNSEFLKCPMCHESFNATNRVPKLLPCQHSYCQTCLNSLIRGPTSIDCNICRVNHTLNPNAVQTNTQLLQHLSSNSNIAGVIPGIYGSQQGQNNPPQQYPPQQFPPQQYPTQQFPPHQFPPHQFPPQQFPQQNQSTGSWDEAAYLKKIFDEMDHNRDGKITGQELHEALRKGQESSQFDPITVQYLLKKYDRDNDNEINFNEFHQLFVEINNQYNEFLDIDLDFSGSIDSQELANALRRKNYTFSADFFNFLFFELSKRSGKQTISFDIYVRVTARFDQLKYDFKNSPQNRGNSNVNSMQLEQFIKQYFF